MSVDRRFAVLALRECGSDLMRDEDYRDVHLGARLAERHWHWPEFGNRVNANMTDRELMGLPERFWRSHEVVDREYARRVTGLDAGHLVADLGRCSLPLRTRLTAGALLALVGDPRINPFNPPMCTIPGGTWELGLALDQVDAVMKCYEDLGLDRTWIEKEVPKYSISLAPFRLARYPITNLEYVTFLSDTGYTEIPSSWRFGRYPQERANHPVFSVSPEAADAYVAWLRSRTGRAFRLPKEAEWEVAAAGHCGLEFPWGDVFLPDCANTLESGLLDTSPVGAFPAGASPFGVMDMGGNVEEYVADDYTPYGDGRHVSDDLTETLGSYRIARGGSFTRFRDLARTRRRHGRYPRDVYVMGFRIAEDGW